MIALFHFAGQLFVHGQPKILYLIFVVPFGGFDCLSRGGEVCIESGCPLDVAILEILAIGIFQCQHGLSKPIAHICQRIFLPLSPILHGPPLKILGLHVVSILFAQQHALVDDAQRCLKFLSGGGPGSCVKHQ